MNKLIRNQNVGTRLLPCSLPECAALFLSACLTVGRTQSVDRLDKDPARSALASWLSRITASSSPGSKSSNFDWVNRTGACVSWSMNARRSLGYDGSSGTYAPPGLQNAQQTNH